MKAEAEKAKAEHGIEQDAPEGFGQAPQDAATFKPVVFKSKKRALDTSGDQAKGSELEKKRKLNEE